MLCCGLLITRLSLGNGLRKAADKTQVGLDKAKEVAVEKVAVAKEVIEDWNEQRKEAAQRKAYDREKDTRYTDAAQNAVETLENRGVVAANDDYEVLGLLKEVIKNMERLKEDEVKAKIKELENKGYELVSNTYPEGGKFDKDKDIDQEFKVTLKAKVVTVTPDQPKTPGTPVDPNNPEGPKYPAGLEEKDLNKTVTRTITYVYADGTPVMENGAPKVVTQEAKFTREAKVNLVTGEVTYGDWTPAQDLAEVKSPVVKGYLADKATVPATKVTADSENTTEVVTYKPIGSWIPNIPGQPTSPIKYPNDPTDPTKGYVVPKIPTNPGEDTPIIYVPIVNDVKKPTKQTVKFEGAGDKTPGDNVQDDFTFTGKENKASGTTT